MLRWQLSQEAVVGTWLGGLPGAVVPLWHVAHVPDATPVWSKRAPTNVLVLWQVSHASGVGT